MIPAGGYVQMYEIALEGVSREARELEPGRAGA